MDKMRTCCFTGHRDIPAREMPHMRARTELLLRALISKGYIHFITGGAVGFDTAAAFEILKLRKSFPMITLTVVSPYAGQSDNFSKEEKMAFERIKNEADQFIILRMNYQKGCMMERNRYMVDNSSFCLAYLKDEKSGTGNTVAYALKKGLKVINIYDGPLSDQLTLL